MRTTIQIDVEMKKMLDELKIHPRESYSSVVKRLIQLKIDEEPLSKETIKKIEDALEDIKKKRVYSTEEVRRILGIK